MSAGHDLDFSHLLRSRRRALGLTQEELAERAGLSVRAISDLERGVKIRPHVDTIDMLAGALGLTSDESASWHASVRRRRGPYANSAVAQAPQARPHPLIGREDQVAAVKRLLCVERVRLLTLTGPGGVGKTSLALEVSVALADRYRDGSVFVDLAPVNAPAMVVPVIGRHMRPVGPELPSGPDALLRWMSAKSMLLVLDNFEHVLEAGPLVAAIVESCLGVQIVATSRSVLRLRAEWNFEVPPLEVPAAMPLSEAEAMRYPAVALFVERARAARPGFMLGPSDVASVAAICRRVDGLPLAIELAAARVRILPPHALLEHLSAGLGVLEDGPRDAPKRQRTMRSAIAWSYGLLDSDEAELFRACSVFVGGIDLDAVLSPGAEGASGPDLRRVTSLVDMHLLVAGDAGGRSRLGMLEVIREFALEQLRQEGEEGHARERHLAHVLALATRAEGELWGGEQAHWFRRLDVESANLRAALQWAIAEGKIEPALRLAGVLWRFWIWQGDHDTWRSLIETGLDAGAGLPGAARVKALLAAGWLAIHQRDFDAAARWSEEHLRLARGSNDLLEVRHALSVLGMALRGRGRSAGAIPLFAETVDICRTLGNMQYLAPCLFNLGLARVEAGEGIRAIPVIEEALDLFRQQGEKYIASTACRTLGHILLDQGDADRANDLFRESLRASIETGHRTGIAESLEDLAAVLASRRIDGDAARLLGAVDRYREEMGLKAGVEAREERASYHPALRTRIAALRAHLGDERWHALMEEGATLTLEEAVALAGEGDRGQGETRRSSQVRST